MSDIYILIANASEARLFKAQKLFGEWQLFKELSHPESRDKGLDLVSDRLGHFQNAAMGHGSFVESSDPKAFEADRFAKILADLLEDARKTNTCESIVVVAPPKFRGKLNDHFTPHVQNLISPKSLTKDYTRATPDELIAYLKIH